jgi:hypothetical protein
MARFSAQRIALLTACLLASLAHAQTAAPQDDPSTLHVYVNLVQIPVLILNSSLHPIARVPDSQFNVSIEGLGRIKPARIRLEGDDPIDLTLLIDRSVRDDGLWNDLPKSLDPLIQSLQPHDHLTVFAMDGCKGRRLGEEMAAFGEDKLRLSVTSAMEIQPYWAGHHRKEECPLPLGYWDMVFYAARRLSQSSGRKLIITLGPGASINTQGAANIHNVLLNNSISLFPIVHNSSAGGLPISSVFLTNSDSLIPLMMQAEESGGVVLGATWRSLAKTLAQPVLMARGRYILEFPRPDSLPAGQHHITVADGHPRDFIRSAGISVPVADPKEIESQSIEHGLPVNNAAAAGENNVPIEVGQQHSQPSTKAEGAPAMVVTPAVVTTTPPASGVIAAKPPVPPTPADDPTDITRDLRSSH